MWNSRKAEPQPRSTTREGWRRARWWVLSGVALASTLASADHHMEHGIKSGFIYNFVKFIEWPEKSFSGPAKPYVIGVIGDSDFQRTLAPAVAGKSVRGRGFEVEEVSWDDAEKLARCHVVYLSDIGEEKEKQVLRALAERPVLSIGESEDFIRNGGILRFFFEERRVRFELHRVRGERAGLVFRAQLLRLARLVE